MIRAGEDNPFNSALHRSFKQLVGTGYISLQHLTQKIILILHPGKMEYGIYALRQFSKTRFIGNVQLNNALAFCCDNISSGNIIPAVLLQSLVDCISDYTRSSCYQQFPFHLYMLLSQQFIDALLVITRRRRNLYGRY
ncbi:hypothetical protein D3C80_1603240 [compost metagenome]